MQWICLRVFCVVFCFYQVSFCMDLRKKVLIENHKKRVAQLEGKENVESVDQAEPEQHITSPFLFGYAARQGDCRAMEDVINAKKLCDENGTAEKYMIGLFDGRCGRDAAVYTSKKLYRHICRLMDEFDCGFEEACPDAFGEIDKKIVEWNKKNEQVQATTALILNIERLKASFAWVGDSRAIVIRDGKVVFSTIDHTPANTDEAERIKKLGASIEYSEDSSRARIGGTFALTRILGSKYYLEKILTPDADTANFDLQTNDLIVLASDGVWNAMSNDDVASIIMRSFTYKNGKIDKLYPKIPSLRNKNQDRVREGGADAALARAARVVRDEAYLRGSYDNISAFVVKIN